MKIRVVNIVDLMTLQSPMHIRVRFKQYLQQKYLEHQVYTQQQNGEYLPENAGLEMEYAYSRIQTN